MSLLKVPADMAGRAVVKPIPLQVTIDGDELFAVTIDAANYNAKHYSAKKHKLMLQR